VGSQDSGQARADEIAKIAEGLAAALEDTRESGVLIWVTKGDDRNDAVLLRAGELTSSQVRDLGTLTV